MASQNQDVKMLAIKLKMLIKIKMLEMEMVKLMKTVGTQAQYGVDRTHNIRRSRDARVNSLEADRNRYGKDGRISLLKHDQRAQSVGG